MNERVRTEQIRVLYNNLPLTIVSTASVAITLTVLLATHAHVQPLLLWLAANFLLWVERARHYLAFKKIGRLQAARPKLGRQTQIYSFFFGLVWAWIPLYYIVPDNLFVLSNVGLFVAGMIAGALVSQAIYLPSLYAFLLPIAVGSFIGLVLNGGSYAYLAVLVVAYMGITVVFAQRISKMLVTLISTRFENEELVEALRKQKHEAEQANLAKSKFLVAASHDMRQPLHALSLYIGLLDDAKNARVKDKMHDTLTVLSDLYDRVLEVSQLDAGSVVADIQSINLSELVITIARRHETLAEEKKIDLTWDVEENCWASTDAGLLTRVLDNLLSNAIRYTSDNGSVTLKVLSCDDQVNDQVKVEVIDTGIGIAQEQQQNIFLEYTQLNNPERDRNKGMGLGLAIVQRLCDLLDHPLELRSTVGQGTTFSIALPATEPCVVQGLAQNSEEIDLSAINILLLEDDQTVREAMLMQFDAWGCFTEYCERAEDIVNVLEKPDVVVADYMLPGDLTGLDALNKLRELFAVELPGIIVTGDTGPEVLKQFERVNVQVLHKPVSPEQLKTSLAECVPVTALS